MDAIMVCVVGLCILLVCQVVDAIPKVQPYRTAYHFQPPQNWMNGPMYYKGVYHLFYQYNPCGPVWGNITWAHSVSYDLINWVHIDHALYPVDFYDSEGCFSGSTTFLLKNKPVILYTGVVTRQLYETQNLAMPKNLSDPFLRDWVKYSHNPLMTPVDGIYPEFYRDPSTAWQGPDKIWRVLVGSIDSDGHGMAILYRSKNFIDWKMAEKPLHSSNKTKIWECPDFYPVSTKSKVGLDTSTFGKSTKHVLKISLILHHDDHYILGTYNPKTEEFKVESDFMDRRLDLRYDYGKFYASKTFFDSAKKRRILWGWIEEFDNEQDAIKRGWAGLQAIPRSIVLGKTGKHLVQWPVEEVNKLRAKKVSLANKELKSGVLIEVPGITASQFDIEVSFDAMNLKEAELLDPRWTDPQLLCSQKAAAVGGKVGPFGLLVLASKDLSEKTAVFFRIFRRSHDNYAVLMCNDASKSTLRERVNKPTYGAFVDLDPQHEKISLRTLVDHSIVETFGGEGRTCITTRIYPKLAIFNQAHLYAFNNGTQSVRMSKLNAWSMKKAQFVSAKSRKAPPMK